MIFKAQAFENKMANIVDDMVCPITHVHVTKLNEPVCAPDGHTYEKKSIELWLLKHGTSPMTRKPMCISQLVPNRILGGTSSRADSKTPEPEKYEFALVGAIDISGSMAAEVEIVNQQGIKERHGLSRLDLAKHSLVTLVHAFSDQHLFGIVTFDGNARTVLPLTRMNSAGKIKALQVIKSISPGGTTNIWEGLRTAFRVVDSSYNGKTVEKRHVWLLTDGQPTYDPPKPYEQMIADYNRQNGSHRDIRTFGFSYEIDSSLLKRIAAAGKSGFSFIPDPGFVGTAIVHAFANTRHPPNQESPGESEKRIEFLACLETLLTLTKLSDNWSSYSSGPYGRTPHGGSSSCTVTSTGSLEEAREFYDQYCRNSTSSYQEEQIKIALSKVEWWDKWGRHYTRSLSDAHRLRECNNFKDPSVQKNARGDEWKKTLSIAHELFCDLPAPEPSATINNYHGSSSPSVRRTQVASLRNYSQVDNGCLHEYALVSVSGDKGLTRLTRPGRVIPCKDIEPGMEVYVLDVTTGELGTDTVECIVKTECGTGEFMSIITSDEDILCITKWHPIFDKNTTRGSTKPVGWKFPAETQGTFIRVKSDYVYSFVLKNRSPTIMIASYPCITLAHGLEDDIARHPFWGTERVVDSLKEIDPQGWKFGVIELSKSQLLRNKDGEPVGFSRRKFN